jgi:hypothetical protein
MRESFVMFLFPFRSLEQVGYLYILYVFIPCRSDSHQRSSVCFVYEIVSSGCRSCNPLLILQFACV